MKGGQGYGKVQPFETFQLQLYLVTWTSSAPSEAFVYSNFFARVSAAAAVMDSETLAEASARHQTDGSTSPSNGSTSKDQ